MKINLLIQLTAVLLILSGIVFFTNCSRNINIHKKKATAEDTIILGRWNRMENKYRVNNWSSHLYKCTGQYQFKRTDQNETKIKYKKFKFIKNYFGFFAIQLPELEHNVESEALLVKCTLRIFFIPLYFKRVPIADLKNIKGPGVYVLPEKNLHYEPIFGYVPFSIQILDDGKYNDTVKYFKFRYPGYSHFEDFIFLKE